MTTTIAPKTARPAVVLDNVGVRFRLDAAGPVSLRRDGLRAVSAVFRKRRRSEFWALRDIGLEIRPGEIFGVIGGNGAGKSTLLKIMAGIYPPTTGSIRVEGIPAPLIELGAAFNPELTGAENIFLSGSIYRVPRREIRRRFDEIAEFSGIREFLHVPVKNYSSGMFIRLAFSIIIIFRPDIVLIDEVFSVGDEIFQQKSFEKILSFRERGAAIVLVSHDLNLVARIAGRVAVLSRGRLAFVGEAGEAVAFYRELLLGGESLDAVPIGRGGEPSPAGDSRRFGDRRVEITSIVFTGADGLPQTSFRTGEQFEARLAFNSKLVPGDGRAVFGVGLHTVYRMLIYGPNTRDGGLGASVGPVPGPHAPSLNGRLDLPASPGEPPLPPRGVVRFIVPSLTLLPGDYLFSASVYDATLNTAHDHHDQMYRFRVEDGGAKEYGTVRIQSRWELEEA